MSDNLRDEITELTEAVHQLRDREVAAELAGLRAEVEKLRAERGAHQCHGCTCTHVHWYQQTYPIPGCAPYVLPQVWTRTVGITPEYTVTTTNTTGYNPASTTLSISN